MSLVTPQGQEAQAEFYREAQEKSAEVFTFLQAQGPQPARRVFEHFNADRGIVIREAMWRLIDRCEVIFTPDRKLEVAS